MQNEKFQIHVLAGLDFFIRHFAFFIPLLAVSFLWHYPGPCGRWALPTTLPCGARTFLPRGPLAFGPSPCERPSGRPEIDIYHIRSTPMHMRFALARQHHLARH